MSDTLYVYPGATQAEAYEWLNRCTDPDQRVETLLWRLAPWAGKMVLDIGAGSGFHTQRFAARAAHVYAVEPDARLRQQMYGRFSHEPVGVVSVLAASAESIPLRDHLIDVACARFAYFFGTDACLPGLAEVRRVVNPGGDFFVIDAWPDYGEWGQLTRAAYPQVFPPDYHRQNSEFYERQGFTTYRVETVFRAPNHDVLQQVFQMDFPQNVEDFMQVVQTLELGYGIAVYHLHLDSAP